jgi:drug/metabolite transporter (DMT)-like permease
MMPSSDTPGVRPYLALGVGILSLGFSPIFVRWAQAPGIVSSFYRMALAGVLLGLPFWRSAQAPGRLSGRGVLWAILGGALFAGDVGTWATGVMLGGATNPTLLANVAPVWVALAALIVLRERLGGWFWLGLALAFAGAGLVLRVDLTRGVAFGQGSALGLLASVFYGGYLFVTQLGRRYLDSLSYTWIACASSSVLLLGACLVMRLPLTGYPTASYLNFLAMALVAQVLGYLVVTYALGRLPASLVAPALLTQPLATAALAVPLLGERILPLQAVGGLVALAGVVIVFQARRNSPIQG